MPSGELGPASCSSPASAWMIGVAVLLAAGGTALATARRSPVRVTRDQTGTGCGAPAPPAQGAAPRCHTTRRDSVRAPTDSLHDGTIRRYAVTDVTRTAKPEVDWADVFVRDGAHRLVLVTCGGTFQREVGHYADNVIVTAQPLGGG